MAKARGVLVLVVIGALAAGFLIPAGALPVAAQSYGPDITTAANAINCGTFAGQTDDDAFDDLATGTDYWASSQTNVGISGVACIGQDFGSGTLKHVRQFSIKQRSCTANCITSVMVQNSSDGSAWNTVQTITLTADASIRYYAVNSSQASRYWRLLAGAESGSVGQTWQVWEIEMMELVSWPTDTPGPSATPTITLTPSTTPSPTPDYNIAITSTLGAPMKIERSATYGDTLNFVGLMMILGLMFIVFARSFWSGTHVARPPE